MVASRAGSGHSEDRRFPRAARVRHGEEIRALFRTGRRSREDHLDLFWAPGFGARSRFGAVVPKHRRSIVERNRLRRRLREIGRLEVLPRLEGCGLAMDLLVRARPEAYEAPFDRLRAELVRMTERLCSDASPSP